MSNTNHIERLTALEKSIREAERIQIQGESKRQSLLEQYKETQNELQAMNIDVANLDEEIAKLEEEIEKDFLEIEELLPMEMLNK